MSSRLSVFVWLFGFLSLAAPAAAAESAVAATVGDDPVEVAETQRMMDLIFREKKLVGDLLAMARAQVLEEIINRRLVLAYARRTGDAPSAAELAKAKKELQLRLAAQGRRVSDVLKAESISAADLERQVLWRLVWDSYLAKYRTPQRRETWFQNHHADVDGTELIVSHILLRPAAGADSKDIEALKKQAESIRAEITSGKLDFAAAAKRYSAGPERQAGRPAGQNRPPRSAGRVVFWRGLPTQGRRDQPAGPNAFWRRSDPLRRGPARNEDAFRSQRADRRGTGQGAARKTLATGA